ncbi:MAG: endo-1,4-beta-xylanase [Pseudomonadales bacterium]
MPSSRRQFIKSAAAIGSLMALKFSSLASAAAATGLRQVFKDDFSIGTAIPTKLLASRDAGKLDLVAREFSAITAENAMKWQEIRPELNKWRWTLADRLVDFGAEHRMQVVGHALVWHSQVPDAVFFDASGKPLGKKALLARMEEHINTLVGRYQGQIAIWDVVNEAFAAGRWRKSRWFNQIGKDYFEQAFRYAHEADPKAQLIYNDYGMGNPKKQQSVISAIKACRARGVKVHGVGMQSHLHLDGPSLRNIEKAILAFAKADLRVHITELDVDVLPQIDNYDGAEISTDFAYAEELNPYAKGLPAKVQQQLTRRYEDVFKLYIKHKDKIDRVSLWGTSDDESWKNNWPVKGRTNYPLLFDRNRQPKPAYHAIANLR